MQRYADAIIDRHGKAVAGASVLVKTLAGATATIYSANSTATAKDNPISVNSLGQFDFYAADGRYTLEIYVSGTLYGMPASRILRFALTRRCAIVASGTRNARAISSVSRPPSIRRVSAT